MKLKLLSLGLLALPVAAYAAVPTVVTVNLCEPSYVVMIGSTNLSQKIQSSGICSAVPVIPQRIDLCKNTIVLKSAVDGHNKNAFMQNAGYCSL